MTEISSIELSPLGEFLWSPPEESNQGTTGREIRLFVLVRKHRGKSPGDRHPRLTQTQDKGSMASVRKARTLLLRSPPGELEFPGLCPAPSSQRDASLTATSSPHSVIWLLC